MKDFTHIRLRQETYERLVHFRKNSQSFDSCISVMLNYFSVTNIAPESCQTSPTAELKGSIERVVKILKALEKDYFKDIREIKTYISKGKEQYLHEHADEIVKNHIGDGLSSAELNEFLGAYEAEKERANRLDKLVEEQRKEIMNLRQNSAPARSGMKEDIIDQINMLKEDISENGANYIINKNIFNNAISDIKKILK